MVPCIRHRSIRFSFVLFVFGLFLIEAVRAQQECSVAAVRAASEARNIFNTEQERDLGEIEAKLLENTVQVVPDSGSTGYVTAIKNRLLPAVPAGIGNIRIVLVDAPRAEAFSAGSSRIYITRKMIGELRNDDELAGLLGHELSHMITHHNAIVVSQVFHDFLGVSTVGDQKDIADKFKEMLNSKRWDSSLAQSTTQRMQQEEEIDQYEADRFALYAAAASGFAPRAYAEFYDRFTGTRGKPANLLSGLLGDVTPNERRSHEIHKSLHSLPKACREIPSSPPSAEFLAWQAEVAGLPGLPLFERRQK